MASVETLANLPDVTPHRRFVPLPKFIRDLSQFWLVRGPKLLSPWAPFLSDALADGAWISPWRALTAVTPIAAVVFGFITSFQLLGFDQLYSSSPLFMGVVIASAIFSGPMGLMLLFGYATGDVLSGGGDLGRQFTSTSQHGLFPSIARGGGSQVLEYLLLAFPAIGVPRCATSLVRSFPVKLPTQPLTQVKARLVVYPVVCALLVYLWCQGMTMLIRPLFTWRDAPVTAQAQAIETFRSVWIWLVLAAVIAALGRVLLEAAVQHWLPWRTTVARMHRLRYVPVVKQGARWRQIPVPLRILFPAGMTTLVLAGLYRGWSDALLIGIVATVLASWRVGLKGRLPAGLGRRIDRVTPLVRFGAALVVGYIGFELVHQLIPSFVAADPSRPLVSGALFSLIASHLLFPGRPVGRLVSRVSSIPLPKTSL